MLDCNIFVLHRSHTLLIEKVDQEGHLWYYQKTENNYLFLHTQMLLVKWAWDIDWAMIELFG